MLAAHRLIPALDCSAPSANTCNRSRVELISIAGIGTKRLNRHVRFMSALGGRSGLDMFDLRLFECDPERADGSLELPSASSRSSYGDKRCSGKGQRHE